MTSIHAIFENGVFRPTEPVDLPDNAHVVFEPRVIRLDKAPSPAQAAIYEILSRSYDFGDPDWAERHNEHQP